MDDAELLLRIRVVVGSTRAAARSVRADTDQVVEVLQRGRALLDAMAPAIERNGSDVVRDRFAEAKDEIAAMGPEGRSEADRA